MYQLFLPRQPRDLLLPLSGHRVSESISARRPSLVIDQPVAKERWSAFRTRTAGFQLLADVQSRELRDGLLSLSELMLLAVLNRVGQIARLAIFALAETMVAGLPAQGADPDVFDITLARMHWEKAQTIAGSISGTTRNKTVYAVRPSPDFPDDEWFNEVKQNKDVIDAYLGVAH